MSQLVLHQLAPSPNSAKVRIALGLKQIPCEIVSIDPTQREEVVRLSGQPRTPILVHDDRVIYDSFGILRYFDANFRRGPALFSTDRDGQGDIEKWELWTRTQLGEPVGAMFGQAFAPEPDAGVIRAANESFSKHLQRIEDTLAEHAHLRGEALDATDVTVAPFVHLGMIAPSEDQHPLIGFFAKNLRVPEHLERTRDWVRRIASHDVQPAFKPL